MTTMQQTQELTAADLVSLAPTTGPDEPTWITERRSNAQHRFIELGLPTRRDEEWRLTNLKPLMNLRFVPAEPPAASPADVDSMALPDLTGPRIVFINGRFDAGASSIDRVPEGVRLMTLTEALSAAPDIIEQHLAKLTRDDDAFTALNTTHLDEVAVALVEADADIAEPITVLNITQTPGRVIATHPRLLVVAGAGSRVSVVEDHVGTGDQAYFTNAVTEVFVAANAHVTHYFLEREASQAVNISTLKVRQERDSNFISHTALLGGLLVRNNVNPILDGENIESTLNGLYLGADRQVLDNHMRVEHAQPHGNSRQYYKGVLNDSAQGIFSGRIVVAEGAQKTDAIQSNQNLLLTPTAQANAKPQLEIYADDVRCTHGATIGELDAEAMFYLRSRGMSEASAKSLLIYAFASESLARIAIHPVRHYLQRRLIAALPDSDVIQGILASDSSD